jgi:hypothetical protein
MSGSWSRRADRDLEERGSFCQNALPSQPRNKGSNSKVHAGFAMDGKPTILLSNERQQPPVSSIKALPKSTAF